MNPMKKSILPIAGMLTACILVFALGGWAWWNAWLMLAFMLGVGTATTRLIRRTPGLAEERITAAGKAMSWDALLVKLTNLALPVMIIVAALDRHLMLLSRVPAALSLATFILMIPAVTLTYRAIAANAFFSSHIRIQEDRGHVVVSKGPYSVIRHPGYAGAILFNLLVPLALGSWLALIPGIFTALLLIYRTAREDLMLKTKLSGYAEYAQRVPHRLIPGVW